MTPEEQKRERLEELEDRARDLYLEYSGATTQDILGCLTKEDQEEYYGLQHKLHHWCENCETANFPENECPFYPGEDGKCDDCGLTPCKFLQR